MQRNQPHDAQHPPEIPIMIDGRAYKAPRTPMTGSELKALAGVADDYDLWFETPGPADDEKLADGAPFALREGNHFYSAQRAINPGAAR
jgi:hypothetical protein